MATVESVLLYRAETWTLTVQLEKALDGVYTRMALGVTWMDHVRNLDLYGDLPPVTNKIRERRMRLAGHCVRHPELEASKLTLWEPTHGKARRGKKRTTFVDMLRRDCSADNTAELKNLMMDRTVWRTTIQKSRVGVG